MKDFINAGIADLRGEIAKLEALKDAEPEVAEVLAHVQRIRSGGRAWDWTMSYSVELGTAEMIAMLPTLL